MSTIRVLFTFAAVIFLFFASCFQQTLGAPPPIQRQMEIIEATIEGGSIPTVDPAAVYDTASGELIMHVYDTLVFFDGEHLDRYLPQLATSWSIVENVPPILDPDTSLTFKWTYYFEIRTGVQWHNPAFGTLAPADVEYTFERGMVMEAGDNPQWMFYEPLLNGAAAHFIDGVEYDPENVPADAVFVGKCIDHVVQSNSTHVWFNIVFDGAYAPFMQILTQPWSSILSKVWCNSLGRTNWDGNWGDYTGWVAYHHPATPPLDNPTPAMMGTGPFTFGNLDTVLMYWDVNRFTNYWRGWGSAPNYGVGWPAFGGSKPAGYINHLKVSWAWDWPTRKAMFLNGDVDLCDVPNTNAPEVQGQNGIRCIYPLPKLSVDGLFFNYNINPNKPQYGIILDYGILGENGIPRDFFGNATWGIHARKAFAQSIDFDALLPEVFGNDTQRPATAIIPSLPYHDPNVPRYNFNLAKAIQEFQAVPGLWDTGFTIQLNYASFSLSYADYVDNRRQYFYTLIKQTIEPLNPKFHVNVTAYTPMFCCDPWFYFPFSWWSWLADYPDAYNFAYPFYCSQSAYAGRVAYSDHVMDDLIERGIAVPDGPERAQIYYDIQQRAIDTCPSVILAQPVGRHFERDWVCGWYYNPIYSGVYAANLWKGYYTPHAQLDVVTNATANLLPYDVNYDGKTNMVDIGTTAASFGATYGPPMSTKWVYRCDFNNDRKVDMKDIGGVAQNFGKTSATWIPPP
jgi:peptide/nickel transport system substrate-binding protein